MRPRFASPVFVVPVVLLAAVTITALLLPADAHSSAPSTPSTVDRPSSLDWPTYHGGPARHGWNRSMPAVRGPLRVTASHRLDGAVYGSPIVARGRTFVATENDTVYAFGLRNRLIWKHHLATPLGEQPLPNCGNVIPLGITSTPVYSAATNRLFVSAEVAGSPPSHRLYALSPATGATIFSRSLDFPGVDQAMMQQRAALALSSGRVWASFGGLSGDCGSYKGRVVGYPVSGRGAPVRYTVPTAREAGIWAPPGPTVARDGALYVAVGNGAAGAANGAAYDHSDSVLALNENAQLIESFSPSSWRADNDRDLDLGSQGPALVGKWIFQAGKSGTAFILDRHHLGGIGGQVTSRSLCTSFGGTAVRRNVVYVPCTDGLRAVAIGPNGGMTVLWHASVSGSPVVGGGRVWVVDTADGVLHGLGLGRGRVLQSVKVGSVGHFTTPALSGRRVLIGTLSGLTVVRTS